MADFSALKTSIQNYIKQNGNEEITGNLLQQVLLSMVTTLGDSAINDLVTALNAEIANRGNADTTLQGNIDNEATARGNADTELGGRITTLQGVVNGIVANVENGYVYAGIATPSATPVSGKVFYLALTAGTYTNFGATVVPQGINILKYNGSAWSLDSFLGLDDAPTQGSGHLVKSGGVLDSIIKDGSAFDLSAYNNGTTYADLSAALTALNALPAAYKKGGMSMKYVQSSDNKYVQYRLMSDTFNTTESDWQGVDDEPTAGSANLVRSGGVKNSLVEITGGNKVINDETITETLSTNMNPFNMVPGQIYTLTINSSSESYCLTAYNKRQTSGADGIKIYKEDNTLLLDNNTPTHPQNGTYRVKVLYEAKAIRMTNQGEGESAHIILSQTVDGIIPSILEDLDNKVNQDEFQELSVKVSELVDETVVLADHTITRTKTENLDSFPMVPGQIYTLIINSNDTNFGITVWSKKDTISGADRIKVYNSDNTLLIDNDSSSPTHLQNGSYQVKVLYEAKGVNITNLGNGNSVSIKIEKSQESVIQSMQNDIASCKNEAIVSLKVEEVDGIHNILNKGTAFLESGIDTYGTSYGVENTNSLYANGRRWYGKEEDWGKVLVIDMEPNAISTIGKYTIFFLFSNYSGNMTHEASTICIDGVSQSLTLNNSIGTVNGITINYAEVDINTLPLRRLEIHINCRIIHAHKGFIEGVFVFNGSKNDVNITANLQNIINNYASYFNTIIPGYNSIERNLPEFNKYNSIVCYGDSLTQGTGAASGNAYPKWLSLFLDGKYAVINAGVGGEDTNAIAIRQGGKALILQSTITIPADNTAVQLPISITGTGLLDFSAVNPCEIDGIVGTMSKENGNYYFARNENGVAHVVQAKQTIALKQMMNYRHSIHLICAGTNGGLNIDMIKQMIDYIPTKDYLVICSHTFNDTAENSVIEAFGNRAICTREYLVNNAIYDAYADGWVSEITAQDLTDINNGIVPTSLRQDETHLTMVGYRYAAIKIATRLKEIGY